MTESKQLAAEGARILRWMESKKADLPVPPYRPSIVLDLADAAVIARAARSFLRDRGVTGDSRTEDAISRVLLTAERVL